MTRLAFLLLALGLAGCSRPDAPAPAPSATEQESATPPVQVGGVDRWSGDELSLETTYTQYATFSAATKALPEGSVDAIVLEGVWTGPVLVVDVTVKASGAAMPPTRFVTSIGQARTTWTSVGPADHHRAIVSLPPGAGAPKTAPVE